MDTVWGGLLGGLCFAYFYDAPVFLNVLFLKYGGSRSGTGAKAATVLLK